MASCRLALGKHVACAADFVAAQLPGVFPALSAAALPVMAALPAVPGPRQLDARALAGFRDSRRAKEALERAW